MLKFTAGYENFAVEFILCVEQSMVRLFLNLRRIDFKMKSIDWLRICQATISVISHVNDGFITLLLLRYTINSVPQISEN